MASFLSTGSAYGEQSSVGQFAGQTDVGEPKIAGSATYNATSQQYTISAAGANMWADHDECHFVWKRMRGDFILRARAKFLGDGVDPHRKLGWMIRRSLDADSPYVSAAVHGDGLASLQFRRTAAGQTEEVQSWVRAPDVIQLERKGDQVTMSVAQFGEPFVSQQVSDVPLGDDAYVGLFVCSHNPKVVERAEFTNVRIVVPAPVDFVPYQDFIGSNLEVMDVESGHRTIVYRSSESLQAPNWTTDGRALIYNANGRLYRFDLETKKPTLIDTGFAKANNNDHVLSFDGRQLGISDQSAEDDNLSIIYTLPVEGGAPRRVTPLGPSYLHGWSPDGSELVYTGGRDDQYDIYRISVDGGNEIRLTKTAGLDDGPEYSPDGKWIYFNSSRSGRMQIWRMKPDGSEPQQVTDDELNNWFPHVSPDGRFLVMLSYLPEVAPEDHPFYKQVYLRRIPIEGGQPRVVAYVYGGQGTINVPSWSPDSRRIAFVSNSADNEGFEGKGAEGED